MSAQNLRLVCRCLIRYVEILVVIQISDMKENMASVRPIVGAHIANRNVMVDDDATSLYSEACLNQTL